jgi:hypothetical protein
VIAFQTSIMDLRNTAMRFPSLDIEYLFDLNLAVVRPLETSISESVPKEFSPDLQKVSSLSPVGSNSKLLSHVPDSCSVCLLDI